jgi:16S rRNA (cytosine967-C5)-methyltransferase
MPTPVAVSSTVDLAVERIGKRVGGITNAILRRVAARDFDTWCTELAQGSSDEYLSLSTGHPGWIVDVYRSLLGGVVDSGAGALVASPAPGGAGDETRAALEADNVAPRTALAVHPGLATVDELVAAGAKPGRWSPYAAVVPGDPARYPAVWEGRAGVQDEGSQLVALALAAVPAPLGPWLDYCAGPGGKAALLAGLAGEDGERLIAHDLHPHRAGLVAQAVRRYDNVDVVVGDGRRPCFRPGSFARVLVDAPCSGLGALRRRPDARWRKDPAEIPALHDLQVSLLDAALTLARPGGIVAYVTCSPHPHETTDVIAEVTSRHDDISLLNLREICSTLPDDAFTGSFLQLWPHRHGTDAMFCALLRRT